MATPSFGSGSGAPGTSTAPRRTERPSASRFLLRIGTEDAAKPRAQPGIERFDPARVEAEYFDEPSFRYHRSSFPGIVMAIPAAEASGRTTYRMKAREIAACSCQHGCNCQFGGYPNEGYCDFLFSFEIDEGTFGDVDLGGLRFVLAVSYPNAIHEGNGRAALFVDEAASDEQTDALVAIVTGKAGGMPWEALGPTVTSFQGPIRAPVEIERQGRHSAVRVPDVLEMQLTPLTNPVTGEPNEVNIVYPEGGLFWDEGEIATTDVMRFSYEGFEFEHPDRYAETAEVEYTNA